MTGGAAGGRHRKVDYAETQTERAVGPGGKFSVTWAPDGKKATFAGSCPECRGFTETEFPAGIPDTTFRGAKIAALPSPLTLYCECGYLHKDRPADALDRGCGRYWLILVAARDRVPPGTLP